MKYADCRLAVGEGRTCFWIRFCSVVGEGVVLKGNKDISGICNKLCTRRENCLMSMREAPCQLVGIVL